MSDADRTSQPSVDNLVTLHTSPRRVHPGTNVREAVAAPAAAHDYVSSSNSGPSTISTSTVWHSTSNHASNFLQVRSAGHDASSVYQASRSDSRSARELSSTDRRIVVSTSSSSSPTRQTVHSTFTSAREIDMASGSGSASLIQRTMGSLYLGMSAARSTATCSLKMHNDHAQPPKSRHGWSFLIT